MDLSETKSRISNQFEGKKCIRKKNRGISGNAIGCVTNELLPKSSTKSQDKVADDTLEYCVKCRMII